jgi:hypothetical protein
MRRVTILLLALVTMACLGATRSVTPVGAHHLTGHFTARLTGAEQVPRVTTDAQGFSSFQLSHDASRMTYRLTWSRLSDVSGAHIHQGASGQNGPVVVDLMKGTVTADGVSGSFTAADLSGPLAGHTLLDLAALMRRGDAYVNVHTAAHPDGEIRGQLHQSLFR